MKYSIFAIILKSKDEKSVFTSKKNISILIEAGKKAAQKAIIENRILGLSFYFNKGNKVYKEHGNGDIIFVKTIAERVSLNIKKGTILYAKSK